MFMQVNPSLLDIFQRTRKQFHVPITATLNAYDVPQAGNLVGSGLIQLPLGDIFICTEVYATAIDAAGKRLTPSTTFDLVQVNIVDSSTQYTYTNGLVDLNALWQRGQSKEFMWGFYPQQNLTVTFQATSYGAAATLPFTTELILIGTRFPQSEFYEEWKAIEKLSGLN